jgi:hypothetical protein
MIFSLAAAALLFGAPGARAQTGEAQPSVGWASDPPSLGALVSFARSESDLRTAVTRYLEDIASLERRYPVVYSPARMVRLRTLHEGWRRSLGAADFDALNNEGKIDFITLRNRIDYNLELLRLEEVRSAQIAPLTPFFTTIRGLQEDRLNRKRANPRDSAAALVAIARQAEELTRALKAEAERAPSQLVRRRGLTPAAAARAAQHIEHLRAILTEWNTFYDGYDPSFTWWARQPYQAADKALGDYATAIKRHLVGVVENEPEPIVGDPVLAAGLRADLAVEMIPYSPQELIGIGQREFAWIENQMRIVSREMGHGDNWKAALEHTKTLAPPPGEAPWAIYEIAAYSENFIENQHMITLPPLSREVWRLAMSPPERQLINPFFSGGEVTSLSYPTAEMKHEDKLMSMRGNTPHFNFPTVQHELVPGHYLQEFMNARFNRHRDGLSPTPFWREGWALYWELSLWDRNFPRNNPDKMGMLFWRLHRAARIVFSLNYQLGNWTPRQCVDFLVERVGHERANAEAEVRRTARDAPLYQVAYMMGGLQFRALHREAVESGRMTETQFHDAILEGGPMPVELVRARLLGQSLSRDYRSNWRFADAR